MRIDECKVFKKPTKEQLIERWENVLRVLQNLTPHQRRKHWDMGTWGEKTECGTVACAAGHCGMDRWFRRRGFGIELKFGECAISDVSSFFGYRGCEYIFYDFTKRPVGQVIKEVKEHIKWLKNPESPWDDAWGNLPG